MFNIIINLFYCIYVYIDMSNNTELEQIVAVTKISQEQLLGILDNFKKLFGDDVNITNVVDAVTKLMEIVGKLKKLSGSDKKFVVTKSLIYLVKNTNQGSLDEMMDTILINIIPTVIDKLIVVEKGKLHFNESVSSCCIPFLDSLKK